MSSAPLERPLSADEARVLSRLLSLEFAGALELRRQVPHARVVAHCQCGCATVDLAVDQSAAEPAHGLRSPIPAEGVVLDEIGEHTGGVIIFLKDGYLSSLEVYSSSGDPIRAWPPSDRLELLLLI